MGEGDAAVEEGDGSNGTDSMSGDLLVEKTLFLHTGWTERYGGDPGDLPTGGHTYLNEVGVGHEAWNFRVADGQCSGYAPVRGGTIDITKLGAPRTARSIDNITVVWTATRPAGGRVIVGWYRDATVLRRAEKLKRNEHDQWIFNATADEAFCVLVPAAQRAFAVPTATEGYKNFPGNQAASWFPGSKDSREVDAWVSRAFDYIRSFERTMRSGRRARQPDIHKRRAVEDAAMAAVTAHFEQQNFRVSDVSARNLGWDLEAARNSSHLLLEVKGLSGRETVVEITPNEYLNIREENPLYRLCVVTDALSSPTVSVYEWQRGEWRCGNGVLRFEEMLAARAYAVASSKDPA
jgi:hypothetical protein